MQLPNPPNGLFDVPREHPLYWGTGHKLRQLQDNDLRKQLGDYMVGPIKKTLANFNTFKSDKDMMRKLEKFINRVSLKFHPDK